MIVKIVYPDPNALFEASRIFVFDRVLLNFIQKFLFLLSGLFVKILNHFEVLLRLTWDLFLLGLQLDGVAVLCFLLYLGVGNFILSY